MGTYEPTAQDVAMRARELEDAAVYADLRWRPDEAAGLRREAAAARLRADRLAQREWARSRGYL
jgi:hypothetical protein